MSSTWAVMISPQQLCLRHPRFSLPTLSDLAFCWPWLVSLFNSICDVVLLKKLAWPKSSVYAKPSGSRYFICFFISHLLYSSAPALLLNTLPFGIFIPVGSGQSLVPKNNLKEKKKIPQTFMIFILIVSSVRHLVVLSCLYPVSYVCGKMLLLAFVFIVCCVIKHSFCYLHFRLSIAQYLFASLKFKP